jgi:phage/plasmid-like protein (TIGR03299 family)
MSNETAKWLNTRTAIGYTAKRGNAWHHRTELQENGGNHFTGPVPLEHALTLLRSPQLTVGTAESTILTPDGVTRITDPTRLSIVRPAGAFGPDDHGAILGSHMAGYQHHAYDQWLIEESNRILGHADGELGIGTLGLLKGGRVAWAQFEMPENVETRSGMAIRPFFTAMTSCDGSLATGYSAAAQIVVCDNTLAACEAETDRTGLRVKIRHTSKSLQRVADVAEALDLLVTVTDAYTAQIDRLALQVVSPSQFQTFLERWVPATDTKTGITAAKNRRAGLADLWATDERVTPWKGTALGVLQMVNTHDQHVKKSLTETRYGQTMHNFLKGKTAAQDTRVLSILTDVLA